MSSLLLVADYGASSGSEDDTDITTNSPVRCVNTWVMCSAVVRTSVCPAGGPGSRPGPGTLLLATLARLGVKTWLSTTTLLEIVYLCDCHCGFRMRH